jgi:amidase
MNELVKLTARDAVELLRKGEVTPVEMVDAAAERIAEVEPAVNALPTLAVERAREHAQRLMAAGAPSDAPRGYLYGLPVAIKDLKDVAGVRSTKGSRIYANHIPERSDYLVTNIEANGGMIIAKSNTPEFGAGANTFNEVFGRISGRVGDRRGLAGDGFRPGGLATHPGELLLDRGHATVTWTRAARPEEHAVR